MPLLQIHRCFDFGLEGAGQERAACIGRHARNRDHFWMGQAVGEVTTVRATRCLFIIIIKLIFTALNVLKSAPQTPTPGRTQGKVCRWSHRGSCAVCCNPTDDDLLPHQHYC